MLAKHFLSGTDRVAYDLSIIDGLGTKSFLRRHEIAMDHVFAQRLAVPGLDRSVLAPWLNKIKPYMYPVDRPTPRIPVAHGGALGARERFAYNLSLLTEVRPIPFLERHQIALDAAMARSLAVPGLDDSKIKPMVFVGGPLPTGLFAHIFASNEQRRQDTSADEALARKLAVPGLDEDWFRPVR